MRKHSFGEWMIAVRPWSFSASAMPVIVSATFMLWNNYDVNLWFVLWALVNVIVFHAAGNTWSDYFDYRKKVDADDTSGAKTLTTGMFDQKEIFSLSVCLTVIAVAGGIVLMTLTGLPLLWIGLGGVLCTLLYPVLKYNALGDIAIIMAYAFLPTLGTAYVATGVVDWNVLWVAVPVGLITDGILHSNNIRDMVTDRRAGITTMAMMLGARTSIYLYSFEMIFPYVWVAILSIAGIMPIYTIIVFLTLPVAIGTAKTMVNSADDVSIIADIDVRTANLQLIFSLLLSVSFVIAYLL